MVRQSNTTGNLRMAAMCELPVGAKIGFSAVGWVERSETHIALFETAMIPNLMDRSVPYYHSQGGYDA